MSRYWQHTDPLLCPRGTRMWWLGSVYWLCRRECCNKIYVARDADTTPAQHTET